MPAKAQLRRRAECNDRKARQECRVHRPWSPRTQSMRRGLERLDPGTRAATTGAVACDLPNPGSVEFHHDAYVRRTTSGRASRCGPDRAPWPTSARRDHAASENNAPIATDSSSNGASSDRRDGGSGSRCPAPGTGRGVHRQARPAHSKSPDTQHSGNDRARGTSSSVTVLRPIGLRQADRPFPCASWSNLRNSLASLSCIRSRPRPIGYRRCDRRTAGHVPRGWNGRTRCIGGWSTCWRSCCWGL